MDCLRGIGTLREAAWNHCIWQLPSTYSYLADYLSLVEASEIRLVRQKDRAGDGQLHPSLG